MDSTKPRLQPSIEFDEQLGLKVLSDRTPIDVMVVDRLSHSNRISPKAVKRDPVIRVGVYLLFPIKSQKSASVTWRPLSATHVDVL
jgi:hypothetical protein